MSNNSNGSEEDYSDDVIMAMEAENGSAFMGNGELVAIRADHGARGKFEQMNPPRERRALETLVIIFFSF